MPPGFEESIESPDKGDVVVYVGDDILDSVHHGDSGVLYYVDSNEDAHVRWDEHGMGIVPVDTVRKARPITN
jgi:hypothetical protein